MNKIVSGLKWISQKTISLLKEVMWSALQSLPFVTVVTFLIAYTDWLPFTSELKTSNPFMLNLALVSIAFIVFVITTIMWFIVEAFVHRSKKLQGSKFYKHRALWYSYLYYSFMGWYCLEIYSVELPGYKYFNWNLLLIFFIAAYLNESFIIYYINRFEAMKEKGFKMVEEAEAFIRRMTKMAIASKELMAELENLKLLSTSEDRKKFVEKFREFRTSVNKENYHYFPMNVPVINADLKEANDTYEQIKGEIHFMAECMKATPHTKYDKAMNKYLDQVQMFHDRPEEYFLTNTASGTSSIGISVVKGTVRDAFLEMQTLFELGERNPEHFQITFIEGPNMVAYKERFAELQDRKEGFDYLKSVEKRIARSGSVF